jgi:predicted 2-oxoglutarate/Fe(II)-dependent dioxygenase YbiX/peroxiredoxin
MTYDKLQPGDRVPSFRVRSRANPAFGFDSLGGHWVVLGLLASGTDPQAQAALAEMMAATDVFDDRRALLFLLTPDPSDEAEGGLRDRIPGLRVLRDDDAVVSQALGSQGADGAMRPAWLLIDPSLTVRQVEPIRPDGSCARAILQRLRAAPPAEAWMGFAVPAPVLILPDVFEPAFCDRLIAAYEAEGRELSGFMRDQGGRTVGIHDASFKVRRDHIVTDPDLTQGAQARIVRRVLPQIERVHFFRATRMERYLVGCYPAEEGGHFRPHRDNTTMGTAHRRYAVSINLNDDFEGGEVSFPEYGPTGYKAPRGAAVIFSCALLHAVGRVRSGRRYAFLPFLYDEAAAKIREANAARVVTAS